MPVFYHPREQERLRLRAYKRRLYACVAYAIASLLPASGLILWTNGAAITDYPLLTIPFVVASLIFSHHRLRLVWESLDDYLDARHTYHTP